jgi:hypothetical protein
MIDTRYLIEVYNDKLTKTGNLQDAFVKAVWVAYQAGLRDGINSKKVENANID